MEDIGNLLYYIVIFVIALVSWLSGAGKKKPHQTGKTSPFPIPVPEMQSTPPPMPKRTKKTPPPIPRNIRQESPGYSSLYTKNNDTPVMLEDDGPSVADELELTDMESFRKAIIYAEIFNRKEW